MGEIRDRKKKNTKNEEEKKMEKKLMNKLDVMELDIVAGGNTSGKIKNIVTRPKRKTNGSSFFKNIKDGFNNFIDKFRPNLTPPTKCPL